MTRSILRYAGSIALFSLAIGGCCPADDSPWEASGETLFEEFQRPPVFDPARFREDLTQLAEQRHWWRACAFLESADPEALAEFDLANDREAPFGVAGFSVRFPTWTNNLWPPESQAVFVLPGTTDGLDSNVHGIFNDYATLFAEEYNEAVLEREPAWREWYR